MAWRARAGARTSVAAAFTAPSRQCLQTRHTSFPVPALAFGLPAILIAACEARRNDGETLSQLVRDPTTYSLQRLQKALAQGADPNAKHRGGWAPLHVAAANNNIEACKALIAAGAQVNEIDTYTPQSARLEIVRARQEDFDGRISPIAPAQGMTPLHYAALLDNEEMVALLLQHNADPLIQIKSGHTPADCTSSERIKKMLADHGTKRSVEAEAEARRKRAENPLHKRLKEHIIGQDAPVDAVSAAIRRRENGWQDEDHPLVFLFLGSSGIGKTELAKRVAEFLHGDKPGAFIRCDMSEYQSKHEVAKFIGAPPGYVGHEEGGQLVNGLRRCPKAVVLLDEVEKAHTDVLTVLLQLFDEGRLTDSHGNTVDCKEAVFVMTSNLAQDEIAAYAQDVREKEGPNAAIFPARDFRDQVIRPILKAHFKRDEFLGRIHEILYFFPFSSEQLALLLRKEMAKWAARAKERHDIELTWDSGLLDLLAGHYDVHYGARSLQHAVSIHVINVIADAHEAGRINKGDRIHISVTPAGAVALDITSPPPAAEPAAGWGGLFRWGGKEETPAPKP